MAYSKVILNGAALIDLTDNTVVASALLPGYKATKNDGVEVQGTCNSVTLGVPSSGTNIFYITVPNGANDTVTFTFTVDTNGNTTIE